MFFAFFAFVFAFFAFVGRIVSNNAGLLENQLKTQRATAQIHRAAKPVRQSKVHCATTAATRQIIVDSRGTTGLDLRANALSQRHAAQDVVGPARTVVVLTSQPVAAQVQHGIRRHANKRPGQSGAADGAVTQDIV